MIETLWFYSCTVKSRHIQWPPDPSRTKFFRRSVQTEAMGRRFNDSDFNPEDAYRVRHTSAVQNAMRSKLLIFALRTMSKVADAILRSAKAPDESSTIFPARSMSTLMEQVALTMIVFLLKLEMRLCAEPQTMSSVPMPLVGEMMKFQQKVTEISIYQLKNAHCWYEPIIQSLKRFSCNAIMHL